MQTNEHSWLSDSVWDYRTWVTPLSVPPPTVPKNRVVFGHAQENGFKLVTVQQTSATIRSVPLWFWVDTLIPWLTAAVLLLALIMWIYFAPPAGR